METTVQRKTTAGHKPPPKTTAARSVFDLAASARKRSAASAAAGNADDTTAPKAKRAQDLPPPPQVDPATLPIERNTPKPAIKTGSSWAYGFSQTLLQRMAKGDMVRLHPSQAATVLSYGRKAGIKLSKRKLGSAEIGVWRES